MIAKKYGGYARTSTEAIANAQEIYSILFYAGWTLNAVCGVLGNMGAESGYNPWRWQNDEVGLSTGSPWTNKGYGFTQFTPASKYIDSDNAKSILGYAPNFADKVGNASDGSAQITFLNDFADYYPTTTYPITYAAFKVSNSTPEQLALVWLYNYERPKDPTASASARQENARYWYNLLGGSEPPTPGTKRKRIKPWIYMRKRI